LLQIRPTKNIIFKYTWNKQRVKNKKGGSQINADWMK
jgi:hypothetical protein